MSNKTKVDFSEISSGTEALSWVSKQVRTAAAYDAYGTKTTFQVRVLTRPLTMTGKDIEALVGGASPVPAAAALGADRFMFKGRIMGEDNGPRSPHATIPDPCDLSIATNSECNARIMAWHTTFVASQMYIGKMPDIGDIVRVTLDPGDLGKYNLQFATFEALEEVGGLATENLNCATTLESLWDSFNGDTKSLGSYGDIPPPIVGGPSTVADIKLAYPRAAAVAGLAEKIVEVANSVGIRDPGWLANAINFESAQTFSPSQRNITCTQRYPNQISEKCAVGLIQFIPTTARKMGTTTDELAQLSHIEQMDKVKEYFAPYKGRLNTAADVYMTIYHPAGVGHGPNYSIYDYYYQQKGAAAAREYYVSNGGIRTAADYTNSADKNAKLPNQLPQ